MNINYSAEVEAIVKDKSGNVKQKCKTKNLLVNSGEDFITTLLSKSLALSDEYETGDATKYVDYISVGAGLKASGGLSESIITCSISSDYASKIVGKNIYCINGNNAGQSRTILLAFTNSIQVSSPFPYTPANGEMYVIEPIGGEDRLNGEKVSDYNGNTITKSRKDLMLKTIGTNTNEITFVGEWDDTDGEYIISEVGLFYNVADNTDGDVVGQKMFARAIFSNNSINKGELDTVQIKWKIRIGTLRS